MSSRVVYRLQRAGNLLFSKASVGNQDNDPIIVRLLVDTGSSFTTLPIKVLQDLGYDVAQSRRRVAIVAGSGIIQAPVITIACFNCLGQRIENFSVLAVNVPFNPLITGLIGMDFLNHCGAVIDVKKAEITLTKA